MTVIIESYRTAMLRDQTRMTSWSPTAAAPHSIRDMCKLAFEHVGTDSDDHVVIDLGSSVRLRLTSFLETRQRPKAPLGLDGDDQSRNHDSDDGRHGHGPGER